MRLIARWGEAVYAVEKGIQKNGKLPESGDSIRMFDVA